MIHKVQKISEVGLKLIDQPDLSSFTAQKRQHLIGKAALYTPYSVLFGIFFFHLSSRSNFRVSAPPQLMSRNVLQAWKITRSPSVLNRQCGHSTLTSARLADLPNSVKFSGGQQPETILVDAGQHMKAPETQDTHAKALVPLIPLTSASLYGGWGNAGSHRP